MSSATFINIDKEPFVGFWNGKAKTFKPSQQVYMPLYLAEHYAKHLTNKILIRNGKDTATSPKKPEEVPEFMELFKRCIKRDEEDNNEIDEEIASASHNRNIALIKLPHGAPQVIGDSATGEAED